MKKHHDQSGKCQMLRNRNKGKHVRHAPLRRQQYGVCDIIISVHCKFFPIFNKGLERTLSGIQPPAPMSDSRNACNSSSRGDNTLSLLTCNMPHTYMHACIHYLRLKAINDKNTASKVRQS